MAKIVALGVILPALGCSGAPPSSLNMAYADASAPSAASAVDASARGDAPAANDSSTPGADGKPVDGAESSTDDAAGPAGDASALDGGRADAASVADAGAPHVVEAATPTCPIAASPPMMRAGGYCIDATEVTNAQYLQFIDALGTGVGTQPPECAAFGGHAPHAHWPFAPGEESLPVTEVNWCDAYAYCAWAGKRMCGRIGGGSLGFSAFADPTMSEWQNACTGTRRQSYPYGSTYDAAACNGLDTAPGKPKNVATKPLCVGGYPGLFDLSGNAWEWENTCSASAGGDDHCRARGGSFFSTAADLRCDADSEQAQGGFLYRKDFFDDVGIRCCAD